MAPPANMEPFLVTRIGKTNHNVHTTGMQHDKFTIDQCAINNGNKKQPQSKSCTNRMPQG